MNEVDGMQTALLHTAMRDITRALETIDHLDVCEFKEGRPDFVLARAHCKMAIQALKPRPTPRVKDL